MKVGLTIGIFDSQYWVYVLLCDNNNTYIGGGNLLDSNKYMLKDICKLQGSILQRMKLQQFDEPIWIVPLKHHDILVTMLESLSITVDPVPIQILNIIQDVYEEKVDIDKLNILTSYQNLRPGQKTCVEFMIKRGGRCLNASEMGTGKTITGICLSEYYSNLKPQLIVCPSSLKQNWKTEFLKFCDKDVPIVKDGNGSFSDVSIISYSLLTSAKMLKKLKHFKVIIMDESHYIKNQKSQRSKLLVRLSKISQKVILLSGTPSSKPIDLFTQLKAIDPINFTTFFPHQGRIQKGVFYFANRYCDPQKIYIGRNRFGFKFDGNEREWELHAVLKKYMTRKTKSEILHDLPPKTRERVTIAEISNTQKKKFQIELQNVEQIRESKGSRQAEFKLMELVRNTAVLKVKHIINYVNFLIEKGDQEKYLIFAHHRIILDAIIELMQKKKQQFISIDGRTNTDRRQGLVDSFQNDEENVKYAVLSIKAAGTGLNLYKANVVVFCELLWSEKDHIQSEDRAHRSGLTHPVLVQYLLMQGTTDDIIWRTLSKKVRTAGAVIDNKRTFLQTHQSSTFDDKGSTLEPKVKRKKIMEIVN
jgi:SWI/SNF-related matrix-associated actin-dependent regulator 1 of chromatin subfamily A